MRFAFAGLALLATSFGATAPAAAHDYRHRPHYYYPPPARYVVPAPRYYYYPPPRPPVYVYPRVVYPPYRHYHPRHRFRQPYHYGSQGSVTLHYRF